MLRFNRKRGPIDLIKFELEIFVFDILKPVKKACGHPLIFRWKKGAGVCDMRI